MQLLANTTGLVDAPPVADTVNVPLGANTGTVGFATKFVIACVAAPMATSSADLRRGAVGGVAGLVRRERADARPTSIVTVLPLTVHTVGAVLAYTTALLEPPPVADTLKVPFGLKAGAPGLAAKLLIACAPIGVTLFELFDDKLQPVELVAITLKV